MLGRLGNSGIFAVALAVLGNPAAASQDFGIERVKTGILPSGGFYSLYQVECGAEETTRIARLRDSREWCVQAGGELDCFKRSSDASHAACALPIVAGRNQSSESEDANSAM